MNGSINIKELARHCKVSPATVSRVFSGEYKVAAATREKILNAAKVFNYTPQQTSSKKNIALIVQSTEVLGPPSWFAGMLVNFLLRDIYKKGYSVHLCESGDVELLQPNFITAAITLNWRPQAPEFERLLSQKKPVVAVNSNFPFAHSVCTDHAQGIELAVRHLVSLGHRRIGLLNIRNYSWGWGEQSREESYRKTLESEGIEFDPLLICHDTSRGTIPIEELSALLRRDVTALVCGHEDWALPLNHFLEVLGKKVPDDISVITAEVPGLSEWMSPPNTTITQNVSQISGAVADLLEELVRNPEIELQQRWLPYQLIKRFSARKI